MKQPWDISVQFISLYDSVLATVYKCRQFQICIIEYKIPWKKYNL